MIAQHYMVDRLPTSKPTKPTKTHKTLTLHKLFRILYLELQGTGKSPMLLISVIGCHYLQVFGATWYGVGSENDQPSLSNPEPSHPHNSREPYDPCSLSSSAVPGDLGSVVQGGSVVQHREPNWFEP